MLGQTGLLPTSCFLFFSFLFFFLTRRGEKEGGRVLTSLCMNITFVASNRGEGIGKGQENRENRERKEMRKGAYLFVKEYRICCQQLPG